MIRLQTVPCTEIKKAFHLMKLANYGCKLIQPLEDHLAIRPNMTEGKARLLHTSCPSREFGEMITRSPVNSTIPLPSLIASDHSSYSSSTQDVERSLELLKEVISDRDTNLSSWVIENKARAFMLSYNCLLHHHKKEVIQNLASTYAVDHEIVLKTLKQIADHLPAKPLSLSDERQLKDVLTPLYVWLFQIIGRLEGGVKFLIDVRQEVLSMLRDTSLKAENSVPLKQLNSNLKELLALWFSVGFLNLERITWESSCEILQKISEYEAVHPVRNWTDLKRRVGSYRRCFVYTHNSMPREPIVVLHTALCSEISSTTKGIVDHSHDVSVEGQSFEKLCSNSRDVEDPSKITTAIFFSIASTQPGLSGIELGNYLIKRVVQELRGEFPQLSQFSTLSPIPLFKKWLFKKLSYMENGDGESHLQQLWRPVVQSFGTWNDLKKQLHNNTWVQNSEMASMLKTPLMATCAHYLYKEKNRGMALDNVANFHLKNGAVMWRLNWLADSSPRGLTNSCGLMVNYRYFIEDTENNSRRYLENKIISATEQIQTLAGDIIISKL